MASSLDRFPYTPQLRSLMQQAGIPSFAALAHQAGVSTWQIDQLRRGKALDLRTGAIARLSQILNTPITDLIAIFSNSPSAACPDSRPASKADPSESLAALQKEYERLQRQVEQQQAEAVQSCQRAALWQLESLLEKLPAALHAVEKNPELPASRLVPLLRPLDQLLADWGVTSIAPVGSEAAYDPQKHQLLETASTTLQPGDRIRVRFAGYYWGDRLLFRAKVSPVQPDDTHP
ncbi:MAG: nucleotide exchange factor GrpE [Cyanobacteriota bacterium]